MYVEALHHQEGTSWRPSHGKVQGTIEALGNATIQQTGTLYSAARIRQLDGTPSTLRDLVVGRDCHLLVNVGADVAMAGFIIEKKHLLVALRESGETVDDIDAVSKSKKVLMGMGILYGTLAILLCWTLIVPALLTFPVVRVIRNATNMPSLDDMERMVADLDRG